MNRCRNCGAVELRELGSIGNLAPFFLKRVLHVEIATRVPQNPLKRLLQRLLVLAHSLDRRIYPVAATVELQSCLNCSFVQSKFPFAEEDIARLYADYRSDSYNRERCRYEPSYAAIADKVGPYRAGGLDRVGAMTQWLKTKVNLDGRSMLDFGGADGQFLPAIEGDKYVFEVSEVQPVQGVVRISDESLLRTYSYIQLSHVLEHVTGPLEMVKRVSRYLAEDGCLLIEVPQDFSTALLGQLQAGRVASFIPIHEHINLYSLLAVQELILAAGLEIISVEAFPVESPVAKQNCIHALAKRPNGAH